MVALLLLAPDPGTAQVDSLRLIDDARAEQARFERVRRHHLPWTWESSSGPCHERVGRYCFWHEERPWNAPPEAAEIRTARARLLARLDTLAFQLPGDGWIAGQRVRYHVEQGDYSIARSAARELRTDSVWSHLLEGYVLHREQRYSEAEVSFRRGLAALPPEERDDWMSIEPLLERAEASRYRRRVAAERRRLERNYWHFADPLYLVPGNERWTEHLARLVLDRMQRDAATVDGGSWGKDRRELLLRYGWPIGWERIQAEPPRLGSPAIVSHDPSHARRFSPSLAAADLPTRVQPADLPLDELRGRSEYAPSYADTFAVLPHAVSRFRRGVSTVVVAVLEIDAGPAGSAEAALTLVEPGSEPHPVRTRVHGTTTVLHRTVPSVPVTFGLEVLDRESRRAWRARYSLPLTAPVQGRPELSDLLLIVPDVQPDDLNRAIDLARRPLAVSRGERVGLYWEVYGAHLDPSPHHYVLEVRCTSSGLRRLAERVGLARRPPAFRLGWSEAPASSATLSRALTVTLPDVSSDTCVLEMELTFEGREPSRVRRQLKIATGSAFPSRTERYPVPIQWIPGTGRVKVGAVKPESHVMRSDSGRHNQPQARRNS